MTRHRRFLSPRARSRTTFPSKQNNCSIFSGSEEPLVTTSTIVVPEVGQAVRVRNRLATVRAVEPYDAPRTTQGRLHIVDVEYLDDFRYPEAEQLLWEVEAT